MRIIGKIWQRWLKVAEIIGNIQMMIILSIIYWIFIPMLAFPVKFIADPLALRRRSHARWIQRTKACNILEAMKNQY